MLFASGDGTSLALGLHHRLHRAQRRLRRHCPMAGRPCSSTAPLPKPTTARPTATSPWPPSSTPPAPLLLAIGFGRSPDTPPSRRQPAWNAAVTGPRRNTWRTGGAGNKRWNRWIRPGRRPRIITTGSAPRILRCHESPLFPGGTIASLSIPGAPPRATTTSAATTSSGRATSSRPPARCWPAARSPMPGASSTICASSRKPTAIGRKTPGSTAPPIGAASRWTKPPSPSCCSISPSATARCRRRSLPNTGPWCEARLRLHHPQRPIDRAGPLGGTCRLFARHHRRGDRRAARRRRSRGPHRTRMPSPPSCAIPRMPGTPISKAGSTSPTHASPGNAA